MIITTWKCDNCGHEQNTAEQMWRVGYICQHDQNRSSYVTNEIKNSSLWCRACCDKLHLVTTPKPVPNEPAVKELTLAEKLENLVREIVSDEIQANQP